MLREMLRQARENREIRKAERDGAKALDVSQTLSALVHWRGDRLHNRAQPVDPRRIIRAGSVSFDTANRRRDE